MSQIQIRRGIEANRTSITPANGELLWTTDEKKLYVGDGSTAGGISATASATGDYILTTAKGAANGVATLDAAGKIPSNQLPALAITAVATVTDEAAMLALTAEEGDTAIRTDVSKTYIHNGGSAGTIADWTLLATPDDVVTSVNTKTGTITLNTDDVAEGTTNLYFTTARLEAIIDDASTGTDKTWSANKIQSEITNLIDDTIVDADNNTSKTLSADKIFSIAAAGGSGAVTDSIDDNTAATDKLWSSSKTKTYTDAVVDDAATSGTDKTWSIDKIKSETSTASAGWTGVAKNANDAAGEYSLAFASDDGLEFNTVNLKGIKGEKGEKGGDATGSQGSSITRQTGNDSYDSSTGVLTIGISDANATTGDLRAANTGDVINDSAASSTTTYSSTKIDQLVDLIDDTIVDADNNTSKTLSADKIYTMIESSSVAIDDTNPGAETVYSSDKTEAIVAALIADGETVSDSTTWSANKIQSSVALLIDDTSDEASSVTDKTFSVDKVYQVIVDKTIPIDDDTAASTKVYSSTHVESLFDTIDGGTF